MENHSNREENDGSSDLTSQTDGIGESVQNRESATQNTRNELQDHNDDNSQRREGRIFNRLMGNALGHNPNTERSTSSLENASSTSFISSSSNAIHSTIPNANIPTSNSETNSSTARDISNGGAIIITVNYVFSDENNPQNPNRTGSLVMTLPNNSSNRDPRVIQEFIRLATQMAYSSIISGINKEKGVTIDKFNSFPIKEFDKLNEESHTCSICFEKYDTLNNKKRKLEDECADVLAKKNKYESSKEGTGIPTLTYDETAQNQQSSTSHANSRNNIDKSPKYLSEFTGTYEHVAIQMPCGHTFGKSCLFEWLKEHTTCPLCRSFVGDRNNTADHTSQESTPVISGIDNIFRGDDTNTSNPLRATSVIDRTDRFSELFERLRPNSPHVSLRRVFRSGSAMPTGRNTINSTNMESPETETERQNSVFSHILTYLRRPQSNENPEPLFPTGVMSRRTENGVETRQTDETEADDSILDFMNLHSLVDNGVNNQNDGSNSNGDENQDNPNVDSGISDSNINGNNDTNNSES